MLPYKPRIAAELLIVVSAPHWWGRLLLLLTLASVLPVAAQHLETVAVATSLNVTQTLARPNFIDMGSYVVATQGDPSCYDEVGYRLAASARWRLGQRYFFVQPEVAYASTSGQAYQVLYDLHNSQFGPAFFTFSHHIRRWEIAPLVGWHTTRHGYILAGPLLALNLREADIPEKPGYPASGTIYNSLNRSVEPVQLAAQVGIGYLLGRFDFSLRLEQSLTPYTRRFTFEGTTYGYRQQIRQGLFTAGFLLYKRRAVATIPGR